MTASSLSSDTRLSQIPDSSCPTWLLVASWGEQENWHLEVWSWLFLEEIAMIIPLDVINFRNCMQINCFDAHVHVLQKLCCTQKNYAPWSCWWLHFVLHMPCTRTWLQHILDTHSAFACSILYACMQAAGSDLQPLMWRCFTAHGDAVFHQSKNFLVKVWVTILQLPILGTPSFSHPYMLLSCYGSSKLYCTFVLWIGVGLLMGVGFRILLWHSKN